MTNLILSSYSNSRKHTPKLSSILDNSALDDYIISAEMDEKDVEVVRVHDNDVYLVEPTTRVFQSMKYAFPYFTWQLFF